ncbi:MAG: nuclear transport factor 2 family protein, partial [Rhizobiaceae bacterium]
MLTESPELLAVTQRWMKAQEQKNPEVLVGLFSDSEHLRYIGTGHGENWKGRFVRDGYSRHTNEIPAFTAHVDHIEAFENGSTGWANWIGTLKFEHMEEVKPIRMTWIFVLERGNWKIAQMHLSTPRTNFEIAGHEHYAFAELIEAAKQISPSLGQQGTATIMFTDVVGSTALNAQFGDKVWASKINEHFSTIRAIVAQDDGEVVKSL